VLWFLVPISIVSAFFLLLYTGIELDLFSSAQPNRALAPFVKTYFLTTAVKEGVISLFSIFYLLPLDIET
jgi:hypothetical protein